MDITLKLQDEQGRPIAGALVLAGAWLTVQPPLDPPHNRPLAAARGFTDSQGLFRISKVQGFYVGEKPEDWLYKMLEAREPKVDRKVTGVTGGSLVILAPGYGFANQPFAVWDDLQLIALRRQRPDEWLPGYMSWFPTSDALAARPLIRLRAKDLVDGAMVTVVMPKGKTIEEAFRGFNADTLISSLSVTTKKIGATAKEKKAVYDFLVEELKYAVLDSTGHATAYFARQLAIIEDPAMQQDYMDQAARPKPEDTSLDAWLTEKALELLGPGYDEPKKYVADIKKGVEEEGKASRARNHFYNPNDQGTTLYEKSQTAVHWGAIDAAENPANEWDWSDALTYYQQGDKARAYQALGHVLHLLEDMAQPERTHLIQGAGFEEHFARLLDEGHGSLAWDYYVNAKRPVPVRSLKEHFDGLARLTFGAAKDGGRILDMDRVYQAQLGRAGVVLNAPSDEDYGVMGECLLPRAIEYAAGAVDFFQRQTHPEAKAERPAGDKNSMTDAGQGSNLGQEEKTAPPYKSMREALDALKNAKDSAEQRQIYEHLDKLPVTGHDDLMALYEAARKGEESVPVIASERVVGEHVDQNGPLAVRLKSCTAPELQDDIASLLDKENSILSRESLLPIPPLTVHGYAKAELRRARLDALMGAAGDGKNEKARAALWRLIDRAPNDYFAKSATEALGKIGRPEDFDRLMTMVKRNPNLGLPLGRFGALAVPRLVQEMDDPHVTRAVKTRLSGDLIRGVSRETMAIYIPLLNSKNKDVVRAIGKGLEPYLRPQDAPLIREMLGNPSAEVRASALIATLQGAWSEATIPLLYDVLKKDPDYLNRGLAAQCLGKHRVKDAVPVLEDALKDPYPHVRENVDSALKDIIGNPK